MDSILVNQSHVFWGNIHETVSINYAITRFPTPGCHGQNSNGAHSCDVRSRVLDKYCRDHSLEPKGRIGSIKIIHAMYLIVF